VAGSGDEVIARGSSSKSRRILRVAGITET